MAKKDSVAPKDSTLERSRAQQIERRFLAIEGEVEIREDPEGGTRTFVHHAPPWDTLSVPLWFEYRGDTRKPVRERFARGAFGDLVSGDVVALFNHDSSMLLGRTTSETLKLEEDELGLRYEILIPDTALGRDISELVRRKDLRGSSFSFWPEEEFWEETEESIIRTVTKVRALYDVGPVTFPAYRVDGLTLRDAGHCASTVTSFEDWDSEASGPNDEKRQTMENRQRLTEILNF